MLEDEENLFQEGGERIHLSSSVEKDCRQLFKSASRLKPQHPDNSFPLHARIIEPLVGHYIMAIETHCAILKTYTTIRTIRRKLFKAGTKECEQEHSK